MASWLSTKHKKSDQTQSEKNKNHQYLGGLEEDLWSGIMLKQELVGWLNLGLQVLSR